MVHAPGRTDIELIGESTAFRAMLDRLDKYAACDEPVLLEGETGTGKELVARALHRTSARSVHPFVAVNCGAIPDTLIESELFGHRRGAFTDASRDQAGLIEAAGAGVLFLDEVDALSPKAQVALLRFLQDFEYRPLGARQTHRSAVRILAASNRRLVGLVESGAFRIDLLYRLSLLELRLPSLRERQADAYLLARHFAERLGRRQPRLAGRVIDPACAPVLNAYDWPGNVRQLENLVTRAVLLAGAGAVYVDPEGLAGDATNLVAGQGSLDFKAGKSDAIKKFELRFVARLLAHTRGNVSQAARLAGMERRSLGRLLKRHGIDKTQHR